jgi:hypothetical protein
MVPGFPGPSGGDFWVFVIATKGVNGIMKRILFCLMALLLAGAGTAAAADGPSAKAPEPVFEFPAALDGDNVTHDFVLQNTGAETLEIARVKTG